MLNDEQIISGCRKFNSTAQRLLYEKYAPLMRGICKRYSTYDSEAKDILQEGFIKVFNNIKKYNNKGSLEGWIRRVIINNAINYYHKNKKHYQHIDIDDIKEYKFKPEDTNSFELENLSEIDESHFSIKVVEKADFTEEELLQCLNNIPYVFKIVFNLYFIENYKHKEIAQMLKINVNTSRTRLLRARNMIQKEIYKMWPEKMKL